VQKPSLSIIIVSFNVKDFLFQAIHSIRKAIRNLSAEIIVVDNASWDGSVSMLEKSFPDVRIISNPTNLGFARANNRGIQESRGEYIVLMNPDTIVQEDTFETLLNFFSQDSQVGMAGCKILNPDGSLQLACRRSFPTPWVAFTKLVGLSRLFPKNRYFGRYNLTYLNPDEVTEVEAISGSFMMVRKNLVDEVGLLDESFFLYGEDLDWCYRIRKAGWKIYYVTATQIVHYKGASSKKAQFDTLLLFYRAMLQFVRKHFRRKYLFLPQWFLIIGIGVRATISFIHGGLSRIKWPALDLFFLNLSLVCAIFMRFGSLTHLESYLLVTLIYSSVWLTAFYFFELYGHRKFVVSRAAAAVLLGLAVNSTITYFANFLAFSRMVVLLSGSLNLLLIPGWRWVLYFFAKQSRWASLDRFRKRYVRRRAIIVGEGRSLSTLVKRLQRNRWSETDVVALLLTDANVSELNGAAGLPLFHETENLHNYVRETHANEVIFSTHTLPYEKILGLISTSQDTGIEFKIASNKMDVLIGGSSVDYLGDIPLVDIEYRFGLPSYRFLKRLLDWTISLPILILSLPVWPIFMIGGNRLKKFMIFSDADHAKSPASSGAYSPQEINDKRPTKVFAFSKKNKLPISKLQKIPILLNVLKGDLTLVGGEFHFQENQLQVHDSLISLKPGLVSIGVGMKDYQDSLNHQEKLAIHYLKNYSPWLDLKILVKSLTKRS
jgi:GT2 family glycosyltransferase/lipopolysaccharide/colanic/teichoic acid biosynthesis glycosyltransferase